MLLPVTTIPIPGALRLRSLHPLIEGDGSCSLIYDLERAAVVEVPEELQFHVAPALETGDLDEDLLGWLANEDLLTGEGGFGWSDAAGLGVTETGWWNPGAIYRVDDELHVRIGPAREETILELVGFVFQRGFGASRVKLHLSWGGGFPGTGLLENIVVEASRLARRMGQEIAFELTLDAREVTPVRSSFLAGYGFQVRLLCGSYPALRPGSHAELGLAGESWEAEAPVRLLLEALGDRLTVHCRLDRGRLLDFWEWAKRTGVRRLDASLREEGLEPGRGREIRHDLMAVCDEMADELAAGRLPIDYKPLTRIVDRLMRSEPLDQAYGERGNMPIPVADVYPKAFFDNFAGFGEDFARAGAAESSEAHPCEGCWARHVCSHSTFVKSAQDDGEDLCEIREDRCALWRGEVEVALRFYHRLAHTDPVQVRRFFDDCFREPALFSRREDFGHLRMPF